ncbi:MAG: tRNA pseudouridine(38-40) synthase TruA [Alphaproteobacteria bacterium]|nr:tRNA pseudouridine(38-40) synthase TruA [Alphaproteobacteria bacterium]
MPRYKITVEYDGTNFCGWQKQKDGVSVQEELEKALAVFAHENAEIYGSGRTDAGVHAYGQVAHFDLSTEIDTFAAQASFNALVRPHAIGVLSVERVADDFHARFSAVERTYIYKVLNRRTPPVLDANRVWHVGLPLDIPSMQKAALLLLGKHDFSTFRASECQAKSPVKTLDELTITKRGDYVFFLVKAKSFLHHQVRNMVGSLVQVGLGYWTVDDFHEAFHACDRTKGGPTAPASGLYFQSVRYE